MKYTWGLLFLLLPIHTQALLIKFENMTATTADLTLDWSDGTVASVNVNGSFQWAVITDRLAGPFNFINIAIFTVVEAWPAIHMQCTWQEPPPTTLSLAYYNIWTPDFVTLESQTATAITFHLDRDPAPNDPPIFVAVPESGSSMLLLLIGLAAVALFRHKLVAAGSAMELSPRSARASGIAGRVASVPARRMCGSGFFSSAAVRRAS